MKNRAGLFRDFLSQLKQNWWAILVGGFLAVTLGVSILLYPFGQPLVRQSYDAFFPFRGIIKTDDVVILFVDEDSYKVLQQPYGRPWDRALHAQLLNRLTEEKAKAVVFDIVFTDPADPADTNAVASDNLFAEAIARNGNVILAADMVQVQAGAGLRIDPPYQKFDEVAAGIGVTAFYADSDFTVRTYLPGKMDQPPSEAWTAAQLINAAVVSDDPRRQYHPFYMNYYGPRGIPGYSYYRALNVSEGMLPPLEPGIFKDKVVFIGARFQTRDYTERKDEYQSPFSSLPGIEQFEKFVSGVEVHANAFLNLVNRDWLNTLDTRHEFTIIILSGVLFGCGLVLCRPVIAVAIGLGAMLLIVLGCYFWFVGSHYWFPWSVIVVAQIPAALLWAVGINSIRLYVQNRLLEQMISAYVSPKRVKQILNSEMLAPGAEKQMLTILFSDIENFTVLSEGVDSGELAQLMNKYFETAVTDCIFKTDGTVVKYIGDAIFSFWNAPEEQQDHTRRACEAALMLSNQAISFEKNGQMQHFRTRVGLHTGVANVGNFGSKARIDYTALGENINLASRMEGLNKYLGTNVLITGETKEGLGDALVSRFCGKFILKGFEKAVDVHELVGRPEEAEASRAWREAYDEAWKRFQKGHFDNAEKGFRCVLEIKPNDGPAKFHLKAIEELRAEAPEADWQGEIELKEK